MNARRRATLSKVDWKGHSEGGDGGEEEEEDGNEEEEVERDIFNCCCDFIYCKNVLKKNNKLILFFLRFKCFNTFYTKIVEISRKKLQFLVINFVGYD